MHDCVQIGVYCSAQFLDLMPYIDCCCLNHEHLEHKITLIFKTGGCIPPTPSPASMPMALSFSYLPMLSNQFMKGKTGNYCFWFLICDCLLIFYHQQLLDCMLVVCWLFTVGCCCWSTVSRHIAVCVLLFTIFL